VQTHPDGQLGQLLAAVLPDGTVWNDIPASDHAVRNPQRSDLMIADLCGAARDWMERVGLALALFWIGDGLSDVLEAACALAV
jgi:hypothetical protein